MMQKGKDTAIDRFSYQLGMINCFVEMVACGVKKMAISPPLSKEDYEKAAPYSQQIVKGFGIQSYLEKSLLLTDLQSPDFTCGKYSILYYKRDDVIEKYFNLKNRKAQWEKDGLYDSEKRREVSITFMRLLSYPDDVIQEKLDGKESDPFMLISMDGD